MGSGGTKKLTIRSSVLCLKLPCVRVGRFTLAVCLCVRKRTPMRNELHPELVREEPRAAACDYGRGNRYHGPERQPILQGRQVQARLEMLCVVPLPKRWPDYSRRSKSVTQVAPTQWFYSTVCSSGSPST